MGEIKSTLDLVMERTKNLTMTDDDKKTHRQELINKKVKGLIQKIDDQTVKTQEIDRQLNELMDQLGSDAVIYIRKASLKGIEVDTNNDGRFKLLSEHLKMNIHPLIDVINEFNQNVRDAKSNFKKRAKATLAEQYRITGSAIIPNLDFDKHWDKERRDLTNHSQDKLEIEIKKLGSL